MLRFSIQVSSPIDENPVNGKTNEDVDISGVYTDDNNDDVPIGEQDCVQPSDFSGTAAADLVSERCPIMENSLMESTLSVHTSQYNEQTSDRDYDIIYHLDSNATHTGKVAIAPQSSLKLLLLFHSIDKH